MQWKERLKGEYRASPLAADGRIYFLNTEGLTTVVAASPRFNRLTENPLDDEVQPRRSFPTATFSFAAERRCLHRTMKESAERRRLQCHVFSAFHLQENCKVWGLVHFSAPKLSIAENCRPET